MSSILEDQGRSDLPSWLAVLLPADECSLEPLFLGSDILTWHVNLEFVPWTAPTSSPKLPWSETYGKALMARDDGSSTVGEIELVRRFREAGWQAGWVDTWGKAPQMWAEWIVTPESLPLALATPYRAITDAVNPRGGGRPDIVAWREGSLASAVFVESKGAKEKILPDQEMWFRCGQQRRGIAQSARDREMAQVEGVSPLLPGPFTNKRSVQSSIAGKVPPPALPFVSGSKSAPHCGQRHRLPSTKRSSAG
jgi:hypothetical protein